MFMAFCSFAPLFPRCGCCQQLANLSALKRLCGRTHNICGNYSQSHSFSSPLINRHYHVHKPITPPGLRHSSIKCIHVTSLGRNCTKFFSDSGSIPSHISDRDDSNDDLTSNQINPDKVNVNSESVQLNGTSSKQNISKQKRLEMLQSKEMTFPDMNLYNSESICYR